MDARKRNRVHVLSCQRCQLKSGAPVLFERDYPFALVPVLGKQVTGTRAAACTRLQFVIVSALRF